jgi:hypothetical protein
MSGRVGTLKVVVDNSGTKSYDNVYPETTAGNVIGLNNVISSAITSNVLMNTAAGFTTAGTVLGLGQFGYETDTGFLKIGDGTTAWGSLDYINGGTSPILVEVDDGNGGYTLTAANLILEPVT